MHEVKRAISLNAFWKSARNEKEERKKTEKNGMQFFCIMKNAAGKQHIHTRRHTHTHTRAEKCIACACIESRAESSWVELWNPDPKIYILKLKCDCLSKCKQSKGCAEHTHTHTHTSVCISLTQSQWNAFLCILQIHKGSLLVCAAQGWVSVQRIIKKTFISITHFPGTLRAHRFTAS